MRIALLFALSVSLYGQRLSLGIVVGGSPTDGFQNITEPNPIGTQSTRAYSQAKDWLAGGSLEVRITRAWSIEADAIFRQLHMVQAQPLPGGGGLTPFAKTPVVTWQFPVLAKYRLPGTRVRPFLETGPSFRTAGNLNASNPSKRGYTVGGGIETHWGNLKIAPTVRYTRWAADDPRYRPTQTKPDQIEFLLNLSAESASYWKPLGRFASIGVILGTSLSPDGRREVLHLDPFRGTTITATTTYGHPFIVGPTFDFLLPKRFSLEVDALYRPVTRTQRFTFAGPPLPPFLSPIYRPNTSSKPTWEFPILLKYHLTAGRYRPFLGAGPTFRRPQGLTTPSPYGVVAAAGLSTHWWRVTITPSVRYNHWGPDRGFLDHGVLRNQTELLVGFSF